MGDIAKGVLGGAWSLLVGWIFPTALNLGILAAAIAPSSREWPLVDRLLPSTSSAVPLLLVGSILLGLILNALQNPLYRILEGYLFWPAWLYERGCRRQLRRRDRLADRRELLRLERRATARELSPAETEALQRLTAELPESQQRRDHRRTAAQRALLREQLARYPVDDGQIAPTRLGNAIRRFEEFGFDRYKLDSQQLWSELTATAPDLARRQVDTARISVDFFIALLYGHAALTATALATLTSDTADVPVLVATASILGILLPVWYRAAVTATDEWAAAVRALVNVGRQPLAEGLGLRMPKNLRDEREMWRLVARLNRGPYRDRAEDLDRYRRDPDASPPITPDPEQPAP